MANSDVETRSRRSPFCNFHPVLLDFGRSINGAWPYDVLAAADWTGEMPFPVKLNYSGGSFRPVVHFIRKIIPDVGVWHGTIDLSISESVYFMASSCPLSHFYGIGRKREYCRMTMIISGKARVLFMDLWSREDFVYWILIIYIFILIFVVFFI